MDYHAQALLKLCRVCGENLSRSGRVHHLCINRKEELKKAFHINVNNDYEDIHPMHFCNSCYSNLPSDRAYRREVLGM